MWGRGGEGEGEGEGALLYSICPTIYMVGSTMVNFSLASWVIIWRLCFINMMPSSSILGETSKFITSGCSQIAAALLSSYV